MKAMKCTHSQVLSPVHSAKPECDVKTRVRVWYAWSEVKFSTVNNELHLSAV